jgi:hypothetical protein
MKSRFHYRKMPIVIPYNGLCITIQSSLLYRTMVIVLPYNGHCITVQWSLYYRTTVIVLPYNGLCNTIQSSLYYHTIAISRRDSIPDNRYTDAGYVDNLSFSCALKKKFPEKLSTVMHCLQGVLPGNGKEYSLLCPVSGT